MTASAQAPEWGPELFAHPICKATMETLRERGFESTSVTDVCRRAGVELSDLSERMRDKRYLIVAVSEAYADDFQADVGAAFASEPAWPDNLRAAGYQAVRWIRRNPEASWWGSVGLLEAGEAARARRDEVFAWSARMIEAGREAAPDPTAVPEQAATIAIGAIVEALARTMHGTDARDPVDGVPLLMCAAVRPYLGEEAARAELEIPPPADLAGDPGPAAPPASGF